MFGRFFNVDTVQESQLFGARGTMESTIRVCYETEVRGEGVRYEHVKLIYIFSFLYLTTFSIPLNKNLLIIFETYNNTFLSIILFTTS